MRLWYSHLWYSQPAEQAKPSEENKPDDFHVQLDLTDAVQASSQQNKQYIM